jgi:hypothetical protein
MAYHISASSLSHAHIQPVHRKQIPFSVWATQQKSALCTAGSKKKGDRSEKRLMANITVPFQAAKTKSDINYTAALLTSTSELYTISEQWQKRKTMRGMRTRVTAAQSLVVKTLSLTRTNACFLFFTLSLSKKNR